MQAKLFELIEQAERARSAKIAKLLELLRDPELSQIVAALQTGQFPADTSDSTPRQNRPIPSGFKTGNGIQDKIKALPLPAQFTSEDVYSGLKEQSFQFTAKDPKGAVRDALHKLTHGKNPAFKMVEKGMGGKPSVYRRVPLPRVRLDLDLQNPGHAQDLGGSGVQS